MSDKPAPTQPADGQELLIALWDWEARYRASYPELNASEVQRIWAVLSQLAGLRAAEYQKAIGEAVDTDDPLYMLHKRG
jgi:hypothetical protein